MLADESQRKLFVSFALFIHVNSKAYHFNIYQACVNEYTLL